MPPCFAPVRFEVEVPKLRRQKVHHHIECWRSQLLEGHVCVQDMTAIQWDTGKHMNTNVLQEMDREIRCSAASPVTGSTAE